MKEHNLITSEHIGNKFRSGVWWALIAGGALYVLRNAVYLTLPNYRLPQELHTTSEGERYREPKITKVTPEETLVTIPDGAEAIVTDGGETTTLDVRDYIRDDKRPAVASVNINGGDKEFFREKKVRIKGTNIRLEHVA